ncbi:IS200/IS605 family accessory protein TnpB-related protein, partial [Pseudomonas aeruginosa]|uniref:IS200/IS605 family accessory protein TnpB-related protein n=1 Tax=Pseudomonas aeruginosa TaxID=287 RepID=UPI0039C3F18F
RLLRSRSRKEQRFCRDVNHQISKQIVSLAKRTGRGISIEDLTGIRSRIRAKKEQRTTLHSWAFHQIGQFMSYKAKRAGVMLVTIDPRNTSRR